MPLKNSTIRPPKIRGTDIEARFRRWNAHWQELESMEWKIRQNSSGVRREFLAHGDVKFRCNLDKRDARKEVAVHDMLTIVIVQQTQSIDREALF